MHVSSIEAGAVARLILKILSNQGSRGAEKERGGRVGRSPCKDHAWIFELDPGLWMHTALAH